MRKLLIKLNLQIAVYTHISAVKPLSRPLGLLLVHASIEIATACHCWLLSSLIRWIQPDPTRRMHH